MKDLRRNEFVDMLEMAELLYEANEKFIKCDIPTLGSVTYYPKANKLQINKSNSWEENGFEFVKNILGMFTKVEIKPKIYEQTASLIKREVKSDEELRDEFAGLAMQGIMVGDNPASHHPEMVADWAYNIADAMIKKRKL